MPGSSAASPGPATTGASRRLAACAALAGGLLALGMCAYQLAQPRALFGIQQYDDGVYLGSALQLAAGRLPYRDFALVQPPGVPLLMVPVALVAHATGTRVAMAIARVITALVCSADAVLAGWLLRHRGVLASFVASFTMATFPADFSADRTLLLEPYLVLFLLVAALLAFDGDEVAGSRRLALAGIAFACAGSVKVWAIFPFAVFCLVLALSRRRGLWALLASAAGGLAVICGPFVALAPAASFRDVIFAQFARAAHAPTPAGQRLAYIVGVLQTHFSIVDPDRIGTEVAIIIAVVLLVTLGIPLLAHRASPLETYVVLATAACTAIMFVPHTFYSHYAYLPDAFLALALALGIDRCRLVLASWVGAEASVSGRLALTATGAVLAVAALAGVAKLVGSESAWAATSLHGVGDPGPEIAAALPAGTCALSDAVTVLISANRYSTAAGCPALVDPTGLWIAADPSYPPLVAGPPDPALVAGWEERLSRADYFVSVTRHSFRIPWDPELDAWFAAHYRLVLVDRAFIYENLHPPPGTPHAALGAAS